MKRPLIYFLFYLILGVLGRFFIQNSIIAFVYLALSFYLAFLVCKKYNKKYALICGVFLFVGFIVCSIRIGPKDNNAYNMAKSGQMATITGVVIESGYTNSGRRKIVLSTKSIESYSFKANKKLNIVLYTNIEDEILPGTLINARAQLVEPEPLRNLGGFDEYMYYKARKLDYKAYSDLIEIGETTIKLNTVFYIIRYKASEIYNNLLPDSEAAIAKSLVLGDRSDLDSYTTSLYRNAGIYHLVAISGLHISVIATMIQRLLLKAVGYRKSLIITALFIFVYCLFTGAAVSTVRATTMLIISTLSFFFMREYDTRSAVSFTAILLILYEPFYIFDVGFQLSFGCIFGIGYFYEPIYKKITKTFRACCHYKNENICEPDFSLFEKRERRYSRALHQTSATKNSGIINRKDDYSLVATRPNAKFEPLLKSLAMSLSISVFTLPITIMHFNQIPLYSTFVNLLVIPFASFAVILGFIIALIGMISLEFSMIFAALFYYILKYFEIVSKIFSSLPISQILVGKQPIFITIFYYVVLFSMLFKFKTNKFRKALLTSFVAVFIISNLRPTSFQITMLDVGQGDSFVIEHAGEVIFIDGGGWFDREIGQSTGVNVIVPYLDYKGIKNIDTAFITHFDSDHHMGIFELIIEKNVKKVILPVLESLENEDYETLVNLCNIHNTEIEFFKHGSVLETKGGIILKALNPFHDNMFMNDNEDSLVLMLNYKDFRMLFTADIGHTAEERLLDYDISAHVLKVGHHGSRHSSSKEFLETVNPIITFISVGKNNVYGHPTYQVINDIRDVGSEIYTTADYGAVTIRYTKNGRLRVFPIIENWRD